jgi:NADPH:quinone reductase-like Zn-dependent oxidoreductase
MSHMIRFHQFGNAEVLSREEVPTPAPGPGEVLVAVDAIGVSWYDVLWRQNLAPEETRLPAGLGIEMAGRVVAVGEGVSDLPPGTPVASFPAQTANRYPTYGDMVLMPRESLTRYPVAEPGSAVSGLSPIEAAVHYAPLLTAYFALVNLGNIKPGQTVLTTEACLCFGPASVQLAKALGAKVIASTKLHQRREILQTLGADHVVVTDEQDLAQQVSKFTDGQGVDIVLDSCGGRQMAALGDITAPRGKLILYGLNGGNEAAFPAWTAFRKHLKFFQYSLLDFTGHAELGIPANRPAVEQALEAINRLTEAGLLRPTIDRVFDFDQAVEAHRYLETKPSSGRVAIAVSDAVARAKDTAA